MRKKEFDVINTSDGAPSDLVKEVYAHFGLCMYLSQVFETGLINILTALDTAASSTPTRQNYDSLYAKFETFTFGRLMKALSDHEVLSEHQIAEILELKGQRDHLAHRFFRDHDLDFVTIAGCNLMIERLMAIQNRFDTVENELEVVLMLALERIGLDTELFRNDADRRMTEMLAKARSRYSSRVSKGHL